MRRLLQVFILILQISTLPFAVNGQTEPIDTAFISKIKRETSGNSHVMEILGNLTDIYGPRLTNSPSFFKAAEYASSTMKTWGLANVHHDEWDSEFGYGWQIKNFHLSAVSPSFASIIAYPKAWSHGLTSPVTTNAVYLKVEKEEDLKQYSGKLRGKIVLISPPGISRPSFKPNASRLTDSTLLQLANAAPGQPFGGRKFSPPGKPQRLAYLIYTFCEKEGAVALLEASSRMQDGIIMVHSTTIPYSAETPYFKREPPYGTKAPKTLPQIVVAAEHYNRMVRQIENKVDVKLHLDLQVEFITPVKGINILAEIPGTDLKNEIVLIGAHFDSWHSATGATDNGVGVAVMMEAMRLIKATGMKPRRTIRIALWGGEEQGLLGSRDYVSSVYGQRIDRSYPYDSIFLKPSAKDFSVYFNMDLGSGKFRGVYLQGNESARNIFRQWMQPFEKSGMNTLTGKNITGTDHLTFDMLGLPAFQFIQDPIEYGTTSYHSNMDVYEKAVESDLQHNAMVAAAFAFFAANRDELFPRRAD